MGAEGHGGKQRVKGKERSSSRVPERSGGSQRLDAMRLRATLEALKPRRFVANVACCPRGGWVRAPSGIEPGVTGSSDSREDHRAEFDGTTVRHDPDARDYRGLGPNSCTVSIHSAVSVAGGGHATGACCGISTAYCAPPSKWRRSGDSDNEWSSTWATKHSNRSVCRITGPVQVVTATACP